VREIDLARVARSFFSAHRVWQIEAGEDVCSDLREELIKRLPHIEPSSWEEREALGGLYVAGRPATLRQAIVPPCRLEYYEPKLSLELLSSLYPPFREEMIIYQDDDLGVIAKPSGLPTTPARDQTRYNLWRYLTEHFGREVHLPSRLDTGVSGLLLCSFSERMNRHLQKAYDRKLLEKHYLAEIAGLPAWSSLRVERPLGRDSRHPVLRRCVEPGENGDSASTNLQVIATYKTSGEARALLQAEPLTGRTHQIRLHCQSEGFPIVGDPYYGGAESAALHLVSYALRIYHPYKKEVMTWELPVAMWPEWLNDINHKVGSYSIRYRERGHGYESRHR